jgi:AcrR family transcriptional regulator
MAPPSNTRDRVVYSALQLFATKGYGSTSVADVRQAAGIHSGSLYHFFPGKQDLLLAVLEAYRRGIGPMLLQPAWVGVKDPVERIFALLGRYRASLLQTECTYGCPIGSLALELHEPDPPVRQLLAQNFEGWIDAIEGCLQEAGKSLLANIAGRELTGFVRTTMEGAVMQARTYRDIARFDGSVRQLRAYFDTLLGEDRRPARGSKTRSAGATGRGSKRK